MFLNVFHLSFSVITRVLQSDKNKDSMYQILSLEFNQRTSFW